MKIDISSSAIDKELYDIYGDTNISALIGENGSGKTTILSFIVRIFRYIQRNHEKLTDFKIEYELNGNLIHLEKYNNSIFITVNGTKKLLLEMKRTNGQSIYRRKLHQRKIELKDTTFEEIRNYLPSQVIASGFDTDYNLDYNKNLICERLVNLNNQHYFESSVGLYVSKGILRFYRQYFGSNTSLKESFDKLNIKLEPYVKAHVNLLMIYKEKESSRPYLDDRIQVSEGVYISARNIHYKDLFKDLIQFCEGQDYDLFSLVHSINERAMFNDFIDAENSNGFEMKLNLVDYLKTSARHIELIEILIKYKALYINDIFLKKDNQYTMATMSTGEKMIFGRLFHALTHISNNSIIIIEEPEIHLNYLWTKHLTAIMIELFKTFSIHLLISSHNFAFINNLQSEHILLLKSGTVSHPQNSLFLSDEEVIINLLNPAGVNDSAIEKYIFKVIEQENVELLKYFFQKIGDSYIRLLIFKKLKELGIIHVESN